MGIKSHKLWDIIGAALGAIILIVGVAVYNSAPMTFRTQSSKGSASFGADFYTYVYSAADAAADNTAITANNLREMGKAQARQVGTCLMLLGGLVVVHYGKSFFCTPEEEKKEQPEPEADPLEPLPEAPAEPEIAEEPAAEPAPKEETPTEL